MSPVYPFYNHRLLYYKGDISAQTLFAQHGKGSVCFPKALPVLLLRAYLKVMEG